MASDLQEAFSNQGFALKDKNVVPRVAALLDRYSYSPSELVAKYENFVMSKNVETADLTTKLVDLFQAYLVEDKELEKENKSKKRNTQQWNERLSWDELSEVQPAPKSSKKAPATPATPAAQRQQQDQGHAPSPLISTSTTPGAFHTRSNAHQSPMNLELLGPQLRSNHLYMVEHTEDRAHAISERIREFAAALEDLTGEGPSHHAAAPTQEPELVVGRICCDCEGRLNEQSMQLESLVGPRVQLDVTALPSYRLFPGQVVGVRALNPTGKKLLAQQLYEHVSKPGMQAGQEDAPAGRSLAARAWTMVVAAGPFTTTDDCTYGPLTALLELLKRSPPDVLVLLGPFVDSEHPLVASGMLEDTFQQVFQNEVEAKLGQHAECCPGCKVVLVPSIRDAHHHPTFPQPPMPVHAQLSQHALSAPNPGTIKCGDVSVATTTHDVLRHLGAAEATRGVQGDRMAALAGCLVGQRSFYPLYPAAAGSCLDLSHHEALSMPCTPDIMLLPSDLAPFAKVVPALQSGSSPEAGAKTVVCINPGRLAKGSSGGTFGRIVIAPADDDTRAIDRRCRVEIIRI